MAVVSLKIYFQLESTALIYIEKSMVIKIFKDNIKRTYLDIWMTNY